MLPTKDDRRPRLPALTSLRFFAAMLVVAFHYGGLVELPAPLATLAGNGYVGVSFFFVLSGFVLGYNYVDIDLRESGPRRAFWRARLARIYPAYLFALALSLSSFLANEGAAEPATAGATARQLVVEAAMLHAWSPTTACGINCPGWSISVEFFFYLVFPLVIGPVARMRPRAALALAVHLWLVAVIAPTIYLLLPPSFEIHAGGTPLLFNATIYNPLLHLPQFLIGAAAAVVFLAHGGRVAARSAGLALGAVVMLLVVLATVRLPYPLVNNGVFAPIFAMVMYVLAASPGGAWRALDARPLQVLGEASYSIYILQHPVAHGFALAVAGGGPPRFASGNELAAYLTVLVAVSVATFYLVEAPARRRFGKARPRPSGALRAA